MNVGGKIIVVAADGSVSHQVADIVGSRGLEVIPVASLAAVNRRFHDAGESVLIIVELEVSHALGWAVLESIQRNLHVSAPLALATGSEALLTAYRKARVTLPILSVPIRGDELIDLLACDTSVAHFVQETTLSELRSTESRTDQPWLNRSAPGLDESDSRSSGIRSVCPPIPDSIAS